MFKKLFHLPTPKELGKAEQNALPLRSFTPWTKEWTWEDHHKYLEEHYPAKVFLLEKLPRFIRRKLFSPISDAWWWMKYHFIPKHRYHVLDLRQPHNKDYIDSYQYGYSDVVQRMLYANFNLLKEYMDSNPIDLRKHYSQEEIDIDIGMIRQQHAYDEAKEILHWWQVGRKIEIRRIDELRKLWSKARKDDTSENDPETLTYFHQLMEDESNLETKTEEMLIRLIKIRPSLWT